MNLGTWWHCLAREVRSQSKRVSVAEGPEDRRKGFAGRFWSITVEVKAKGMIF